VQHTCRHCGGQPVVPVEYLQLNHQLLQSLLKCYPLSSSSSPRGEGEEKNTSSLQLNDAIDNFMATIQNADQRRMILNYVYGINKEEAEEEAEEEEEEEHEHDRSLDIIAPSSTRYAVPLSFIPLIRPRSKHHSNIAETIEDMNVVLRLLHAGSPLHAVALPPLSSYPIQSTPSSSLSSSSYRNDEQPAMAYHRSYDEPMLLWHAVINRLTSIRATHQLLHHPLITYLYQLSAHHILPFDVPYKEKGMSTTGSNSPSSLCSYVHRYLLDILMHPLASAALIEFCCSFGCDPYIIDMPWYGPVHLSTSKLNCVLPAVRVI
jgi:hypothetical protein